MAELQLSHYMPSAAYKAVRQGHEPHSTPVMIDIEAGVRLQTDKHVQKYLLCEGCEQRFSRNGEDHVLSQMCRRGGKFKLRDLMNNAEPSRVAGGNRIFLAENMPPEVNADAYAYFALSIFWRGAVTDWGKAFHNFRDALGSRYHEKFRQFLLGKAEFPNKAFVKVHVDFDTNSQTGLEPPHQGKASVEGNYRFRCHNFLIPGIQFELLLGGNVDALVKDSASLTTSNVMFSEWYYSKSERRRGWASRINKTEAKGKLAS
ncbi:MAG: hypothetical protein ACR2RE_22755 [Geminicoccaceae bacterium]